MPNQRKKTVEIGLNPISTVSMVGVFITQVNFMMISRAIHIPMPDRNNRSTYLKQQINNYLEVSDYERIRKVYYRRKDRAEI